MCGLTLRSSGPPPAWHLGREASQAIVRLAAQAPIRRGPLSSNVMRLCLRSARLKSPYAGPMASKLLCFHLSGLVRSRCTVSGKEYEYLLGPPLAIGLATRQAARALGSWHSVASSCSAVLPVLCLRPRATHNPSLERTPTGLALGPRAGQCHHPSRGPSTNPVVSAQLKR